MCRNCDTLTDGEIWYKDPRQYSNRMYKLREPGNRPQESSGETSRVTSTLDDAINAKAVGDTAEHNRIIAELNHRRAMSPAGQVIPLFDLMEVTDYGTPMAAMMCICRKMTRACEECSFSEYTGIGIGTGMYKYERWPERYSGGLEWLTPKQAKEFLEHWDRKGMMHLAMQEGGDFIGGICNCDYPDCNVIRNRIDYGLTQELLKAEYVFFVDFEKCNGCGDCLGRCHFNALKFEATMEKASIDQFSCFGCGLCDTACPRQAIYYRERKQLPGLANVW